MSLLWNLQKRLALLGCRAVLVDGRVFIEGDVNRLTGDLKAEIRKCKPAILVALLEERGQSLREFIDGGALVSERQARLTEYQSLVEEIGAAREELYESWQRGRCTVVWSELLEEIILVGDGLPPPGSEGVALYSWIEIESLKDLSYEQIVQVHKLKKAFTGNVEKPEKTNAR